jgi:hypothetical protein
VWPVPSGSASPAFCSPSCSAWLKGRCCRCLAPGHHATVCCDPFRCSRCLENCHRARDCRNSFFSHSFSVSLFFFSVILSDHYYFLYLQMLSLSRRSSPSILVSLCLHSQSPPAFGPSSISSHIMLAIAFQLLLSLAYFLVVICSVMCILSLFPWYQPLSC